jgi:hypothetical protein
MLRQKVAVLLRRFTGQNRVGQMTNVDLNRPCADNGFRPTAGHQLEDAKVTTKTYAYVP